MDILVEKLNSITSCWGCKVPIFKGGLYLKIYSLKFCEKCVDELKESVDYYKKAIRMEEKEKITRYEAISKEQEFMSGKKMGLDSIIYRWGI